MSISFKNKEQRTKNKEQRTKNKEQRTKNKEQSLNLDDAFFYANIVPNSQKGVLKSYNKRNDDFFKSRDFSLDSMKRNFSKYILEHIRKNPNIRFVIFFPPSPILKWVEYSSHNVLSTIFAFKEYILNEVHFHQNVRLHDFQIDRNINNDLTQFIDLVHFSSGLNDYIIQSISDKKFEVTDTSLAQTKNELIEDISIAKKRIEQNTTKGILNAF